MLVKERYLYGTERLGTIYGTNVIATWTTPPSISGPAFSTALEMHDHLGNVRATFSGIAPTMMGGGSPVPTSINTVNYYHYYAFGAPHPNRYYEPFGSNHWGFNGQERKDDYKGVGNHNHALYWEYDTRIGRRWNLDPKPNVSFSGYAVMEANPIWKNDVMGDSAWKITRLWNNAMVNKFREKASFIAGKLRETGEYFTCEDFALETIVQFCKENQLPFKFKSGAKAFDAASDEYDDYESFLGDLKKNVGAPDFQRSENTIKKLLGSVQSGDVVVSVNKNTKKAHHIQVVTGVQQESVTKKNSNSIGSEVTGISIVQGNFHDHAKRHLGSNNPSSLFYYGSTGQYGFWNVKTDTWINQTKGTKRANFSKGDDDLIIKSFNFFNWNSKSK